MPVIVYNGYTLPNTIEKFSYSEDEKSIQFSCVFLVLAASAGALNSACQAAETALSEINKDFSLTFGGSTAKNLTHIGNTGFLARPSITKITNELATETSRAYKFSVTLGVPFDQSGYGYRREGEFTVNYGPNRQRTVSFRCVYTAGGANSALVNYVAGGKTWTAGILTDLGGTYEIISENFHEEHEQKILNATLIYKEILAYQSTAGLNLAAVVDPHVSYSVSYGQNVGRSISGAPYEAITPTTISINYSTKIDKEQIPDDADIEQVYQDTVKPWLINHARDVLGLEDYTQAGQNYIVQNETKTLDTYNFLVSGHIELLAPKTTSSIIALDETLSISVNEGISTRKLWDGYSYTYNAWGMGAEKNLVRNITISKLSVPPPDPPAYSDSSDGVWLLQSSYKRTTKQTVGYGTPAGGTAIVPLDLYSVTYNEEYLYIEQSNDYGLPII